MDSRCLTQPARLPGHMELQLFVSAFAAFASTQNPFTTTQSSLFRHAVRVDHSVYGMFLFYSSLSWMRRGEENNKTRRKIPALNCAPLTGPHIVAGQRACGQSAQVRCCTTGLGALHSARWLLPVRDRASRAQQQAAPVHTSTQTFPGRGRRWWETERLFQAVPGSPRLHPQRLRVKFVHVKSK